METAELRLVLQNCFTPETLREHIPVCPEGCDLYEAAIESILSEDEIGMAIVQRLDQESERQRVRIRSTSSRDLRNRFTLEFLEPGRTLGHIVWGLLRDERFIARNLAGEIAAYFTASAALPDSQSLPLKPVKDQFSEALHEVAGSSIPSDLRAPVSLADQDRSGELGAISLRDTGREATESTPVQPLSGEGLIDMNVVHSVEKTGKSYGDIENLIAAIAKDTKESKNSSAIAESSENIYPSNKAERASKTRSADIFKFSPKTAKPTGAFSAESPGFEKSLKTPRKPGVKSEDLVLFKEVEIALASLKRACEKLYNEPIELVADTNIIEQDKIVVVGKQCGVKLLYGPQHVIRPPVSTIEKETKSVVFAASLQSALSRIYDEPVELIPDPELLQVGIVPFAGKKLGIKVMENDKISVTLPTWAESTAAGEKSIISAEPPVDLAALYQKIETMEKRLALLEQSPASPIKTEEREPSAEIFKTEIVSPIHEPILEEFPNLQEPQETQITWEQPIALFPEDNLSVVTEPEKPTAVNEPIPEAEITMDDFLPQELKETGPNEAVPDTLEEISVLDQINLDELTQDEAAPDVVEIPNEIAVSDITSVEFAPLENSTAANPVLPETESSENSMNGIETEIPLSNLGSEELTEEISALKAEEIAEEEINLADLNLDQMNEDSTNETAVAELDQKSTASPAGTIDLMEDEPNLEELNLDILSELGKVDEAEIENKKVFKGEVILLLGGEEKYKEEYRRTVEELGGTPEWYPRLNDFLKEDINRLIDRADLVMTIASESVTDPGILFAAEYAKNNQKRLFQYHSSRPTGIQKQLLKLVKEGKI